MEQEIWKDIKGYEGFYQVSNTGKVRSLDRTVIRSDNKVKKWKGKELTLKDNGKGYAIIVLAKNAINKTMPIHFLVWDYFGDAKRDNFKALVDHIDEDKKNNHIDNLQILTNRDNSIKSLKSKSKFNASFYDKNAKKWRSTIRILDKRIWLGCFNTQQEAQAAYFNAEKKYYSPISLL